MFDPRRAGLAVMPLAAARARRRRRRRRVALQDEFTCIGCRQCVWCASATFRLEPEHGRSRVFAQWLDPEDKIQAAIGACSACVPCAPRALAPCGDAGGAGGPLSIPLCQ